MAPRLHVVVDARLVSVALEPLTLSTTTSSKKRSRKRRRAPADAAAEPIEVAGREARTRSRRSGRARVPLLLFAAVIGIGAITWYSSGALSKADAEQFQIVAAQTDLAPGSTVVAYWRTKPVAQFWNVAPFVQSFEIAASAGPDGKGQLLAEEVFEKLAGAPLGGKLIKVWVRQIEPGATTGDLASAAGWGVTRPDVDLGQRAVLDGRGRTLLFLDVDIWAPGQREPDCRTEFACEERGSCTAQEGEFVATSDGDCAACAECKEEGNCVARDKHCVPAADEHCSASERCRSAGACSFLNGACAAASLADCTRSDVCKGLKNDQTCVFENGSCDVSTLAFLPKSDEDCRNATGCEALAEGQENGW